MKRIYHPFNLWEEYHAGMWRNLKKEEEDKYLNKAIEFTGNYELYGKWMLTVVDNWKISCEHNLSDTTINRQAWIGQAACCLAIGCPEHITRRAWHQLSSEQQDLANRKADEAIDIWEGRQYETLSKRERFGSCTVQSVLGTFDTHWIDARIGVDWKSGSFHEDYKNDYEIQAYILNELFKQKHGQPLEKFVFVFLKDGIEYEADCITNEKAWKRKGNMIQNALDSIKRVEFNKKVSFSCQWCEFQGMCI